MLSDVGSLALAVFAMGVAQRPPTLRRTFGYQRAEILAALANGATLVTRNTKDFANVPGLRTENWAD